MDLCERIANPCTRFGKLEGLDALNDLTDCAIHLGRLVRPQQLPCSHAFCLDCLERWRKQSSNSRGISCPLCRRVVNLTPESVQALPNAIAHPAVAEYLFLTPSLSSSLGTKPCVYSRTQLTMQRHCRYQVTRLSMAEKDCFDFVAPVFDATVGRLVSVLAVAASTSEIMRFSCSVGKSSSEQAADRVQMPSGICRLRCLRPSGDPSGSFYYAIAELQTTNDGGPAVQAVVRLRLQDGSLCLLGQRQYPPGVQLSDLHPGGPERGVAVALPDLCAVDLLQESSLSGEAAAATPPLRLCLGGGLRPRQITWANSGRRSTSARQHRKREHLLWVSCPDAGVLVELDASSSKVRRVPHANDKATAPSGPLASAGPDSRLLVADVGGGSAAGIQSDIWWAWDRGQAIYLQRLRLSRVLFGITELVAAGDTGGVLVVCAGNGVAGSAGVFLLKPETPSKETSSCSFI